MKRARLGGAFAITLAVMFGRSTAADAAPAMQATASAVWAPATGHTALQLRGRSLGTPGDRCSLRIHGSTVRLRILATDPSVVVWQDDRIVVDLPAELTDGHVKVQCKRRFTPRVPLTKAYEYDWLDLPPDGAPLELVADSRDRIWINSEFHLGFRVWDPEAPSAADIPLPHPPDPGPFATTVFVDHPTQVSEAGEDILVEPTGKIWLSAGGALMYRGPYQNHSRIVRYDPAARAGDPGRLRVYDIPGDNNGVTGLAWDAVRGRLWFTENATAKNEEGEQQPAKLVSFDPDRIPWSDGLAAPAAPDSLICVPGAPDADCYHEYPLPGAYMLGHVAIGPTGSVWYTAYIGRGNGLGRVDPETADVTTYPLPHAVGTSVAAEYLGSGPWELRFAPDGDLLVQEYFDCRVIRFDHTRVADERCLALDVDGQNPCMRSLNIPDADLAKQFAAGINFDDTGQLWIGLGSADDADSRTNGLGYVAADGTEIIMLPPLGVFPGPATFSISGVLPVHGDVWFGEYQRGRLGRLRPLP